MDLKTLFGETLYSQITKIIDDHNSKADTKDKVKLVDLGEGGYVGKEKHQDKLNALQTQIDTLTEQVSKRDADLKTVSDQLAAVKTDSDKLAGVQTSLTDLQAKYDADQKAWQDQLAAQRYEYLVKEKASALNFTSSAAKKRFIPEAVSKGFQVDGETLMGYADWLKGYQESDTGSLRQRCRHRSDLCTL